ncbi:hypothetical protein EMCRGX_G004449 [Ephydatia muelleri]
MDTKCTNQSLKRNGLLKGNDNGRVLILLAGNTRRLSITLEHQQGLRTKLILLLGRSRYGEIANSSEYEDVKEDVAKATEDKSVTEPQGSFTLCFLASASSAATPSDMLAAVRMEWVNKEVTVMSKAACFTLSQLRTRDVIARHNKLRDCVANLCSKACLSPQLEKGPGIDFSRPADVLVPNWSLSNPAAFDLKVIHPLNTDLILEASLASGNSAEVGEIEKHAKNDQMCARLGWTCIPLVVEVYGGWGCEAKECYSRLSKRLAMQVGICETEALCQMYCLLAVTLMRQNARAILLRCARAPLLEYSH